MMQKGARKSLIDTARVAGLGALVTLAGASIVADAEAAPEKDVIVVNDPAQPVPVTGSVSVDNLPAVQNVQVSAPVQIDDSVPVAVDTGEDVVRPGEIRSLFASVTGTEGCRGILNGLFFATLLTDGNVDFQPFIVPGGQVFVITSAQWEVTGATPGTVQRVNVLRNNTSALTLPAVADANGIDAGSISLPTGLVLGAGVQPCAQISGSSADLRISVQGYLAADE